MNTQRAYMGADTTIAHWVRDDAGNRDFTGDTLTVELYAYGLPDVLDTLAATSPEAGKVAFTVTEAFADRALSPGVYRYQIKAGAAVVGGGLLEVV